MVDLGVLFSLKYYLCVFCVVFENLEFVRPILSYLFYHIQLNAWANTRCCKQNLLKNQNNFTEKCRAFGRS